ncbi:MAG TPA: hypothetical protein VK509_01295 [Polyangiales bacterium]|nr:hypothetical protein [Polyangiales bacterium]
MQSVALTKPNDHLTARESLFWEHAEALAQRFVAGLTEPLSAEARWGIQCFCEWPLLASDGTKEWRDWDGRFDGAMLARIDGRELVFIGIGPFIEEGWEPAAVLDGMRDFLRWVGACGAVDGEQAERICEEIELAREPWTQAVDGDDGDPWAHVVGEGGCPCCAANEAVAPFVRWLLDTTNFSLDRRLLGQELAISALEQLRLPHLVDGAFYRLDIAACLAAAYERTEMAEQDRRELAAVARAFATFLAHRCGLSGAHKRRMQTEAERWAATSVRAAS